jgi:hypothetical protein
MSTNYFTEACIDYMYLREKGYPEKAALKLVGDRHRLSRMERNSIFRGGVIAVIADARKKKIVQPREVAGENVGIDWYNVLITVESYLKGMPLFMADDGVLRDCADTHGGYRRTALTERAMREIFSVLEAMAPARIDACLDAPIAHSAHMAEEVRGRLRELPCQSEATLAHSADFLLKSYAGVVCSSDSIVMDSARHVLDLPRCVLQRSFGFTPPPLREAFPGALSVPFSAPPGALTVPLSAPPSAPEERRQSSGSETPGP